MIARPELADEVPVYARDMCDTGVAPDRLRIDRQQERSAVLRTLYRAREYRRTGKPPARRDLESGALELQAHAVRPVADREIRVEQVEAAFLAQEVDFSTVASAQRPALGRDRPELLRRLQHLRRLGRGRGGKHVSATQRPALEATEAGRQIRR